MLTAAEMEAYERDGAVTIDGPLSEAQLDEAEAAWDRLHGHAGPVLSNDGESGEGREPYTEPAYLSVIAHPWFEQVAQQVLRATDVHLWWGLSPHNRPPVDGPPPPEEEQWRRGAHVDIQATLSDWQATPRRMRCELWFWLNEVPEHRGAMRVLTGSRAPTPTPCPAPDAVFNDPAAPV